jgi:hypothetical protein
MEIFGSGIGIAIGLGTLAIALWEFPKLRLSFFIHAPGTIIMVFGIGGGWIGYRIFSYLFGSG